jgi:SAM-dependent methyltransferase
MSGLVPSLRAQVFEPEPPWPAPLRSDCLFYHSLDFPDGDSVAGHWDIRGRFDEYIGRYQLAGKTVLDVGTGSGFLAFSAEAKGARVTAVDVRHATDFDRLPFQSSVYHRDRLAWAADWEARWLRPLKRGFWYAWHKYGSDVQAVYTPLDNLAFWQRPFDVVIAGAIVEHLADPVSALGTLARLANEAVIIAFTDVYDSDELLMRTINDWSSPTFDYSWWVLSRGLYGRVFQNAGFEVEMVSASAMNNPAFNNHLMTPTEVRRPTIIARRTRPR